jgi:MFS family permease
MGYSFGFSSPASADLTFDGGGPRGVLSNDAVAWFGSLIYIGVIIGGPLGGLSAERFGRKSSAR